jgi:hypothetical protein
MATREAFRIPLMGLRYERDWRYLDNQFLAMNAASGRDLGAVPVRLTVRGFDVVPAMPAETAATFASRIEPGKEVALLRDPTPAFVADMLAPALDGAVGTMARGFFRSDFVVTSIGFRRKYPGVQSAVSAEKGSASWHCDAGPLEHLKVIIYLSDSANHDGGTAFIEKSATDVLKRSGYVFQPRAERHDDIGRILAEIGMSNSETLVRPECGEAVVFRPAEVMHKAVVPTDGERVTATLLLLPSSVNWRDFLTANLDSVLANTGASFSQLLPRVDLN